MDNMRIGVYGGSFNPVHNGHVALARELIEKRYLDKVLFVPVGDKYIKPDLLNAEDRYKMLKLATSLDIGLEVTRVEIDDIRQKHTYQTLDELKEMNPRGELHFVIGSDLLQEFPTWDGNEEIVARHNVLVLNRNGFNCRNFITNNFPEHDNQFMIAHSLSVFLILLLK